MLSQSHALAALLPAITACTGCQEAQALHSLACKLGLASDMVISTALLTSYAKRGFVARAQSLFDEMLPRDVVAINAMLAALGAAGRVTDARGAVWPNVGQDAGLVEHHSHVLLQGRRSHLS
jgi:hypothetical protein